MVAHVIAGSHLFRVQPEPQRSGSDPIAESIENAPAEASFDAKRRAVLAVLDLDPEAATVTGRVGDGYATADLFARLLMLTDAQILDVIAVAMGESLEAGSMVVEAVGLHLGVDMAALWQPDAAFFELIRDKTIVNALLADIGGEAVASANAGEKVEAQRQLIGDFIDGSNGRPKTVWLPRWMAFPPANCTNRGGFRTVSHDLRDGTRVPGFPAPPSDRRACRARSDGGRWRSRRARCARTGDGHGTCHGRPYSGIERGRRAGARCVRRGRSSDHIGRDA